MFGHWTRKDSQSWGTASDSTLDGFNDFDRILEFVLLQLVLQPFKFTTKLSLVLALRFFDLLQCLPYAQLVSFLCTRFTTFHTAYRVQLLDDAFLHRTPFASPPAMKPMAAKSVERRFADSLMLARYNLNIGFN